MPALLVAAVLAGALAVSPPVEGPDDRVDALAAADAFLDRYLRPDGRVSRTDQGGDTVSEGQAYAMLLAAAIGDEGRFRLAWTWTDVHLQRRDRLLAWRWADGGVADWGAATDADLMAAGALTLAGERFGEPAFATEAAAMSSAILTHETMTFGAERVLLAGPWARHDRVVNPSYLVVGMMSRLWWTAGDRRWAPVAASSRTILDELMSTAPYLPPDWATVSANGDGPTPQPSPSGKSARYGYDAARTMVQLAVDCSAAGQAVAARSWPFLEGETADELAASYTLDGAPIDDATHPMALVAAAASAGAAGDAEAAADLLDDAEAHDQAHPTYYGSAWVALARLWMDTTLIGGCRPGRPQEPDAGPGAD